MSSVFDESRKWAKRNFAGLPGKPYESDFLAGECQRFLVDYPGLDRKKWLFVYSPESANDFFEVSQDWPRLMMAIAKLGTVASTGGMLLGADYSEKWGTSKCVGKFTPLLVCKPEENGGHQ